MSMHLAPWRRRPKTDDEPNNLPPKAAAQLALLKQLLEEFIPAGPTRLAVSPMLSMAFEDWTPEKGEYAATLIRGIAERFNAIDREFATP